ncbi:Na+/H+ antiporter [Agilicoccus flavus]|uniref:Na+/H+ antiporter n=1 Tax=Agilicoccus flavus TaxID=2775968 RepID=UPI001CF60A3A|nr:Na+/H+ antiporter [Agilicoccus flavus]
MALELVVALCVAILLGSVVAQRLGLPAPVILVAAGALLTLIPHLRGVGLPPETALLIFLPLLLYWESLTTSPREIRRFLRGILLTGTLLVVVTAAAVACVLHALGVDWGPAWIVGAALAPTDATAVAALGRGLARRNSITLQAESLINDGTALVVFALALTLATGAEPITVSHTAGLFAVSFGVGILIGLGVGWFAYQLRRHLSTPEHLNLASVLTPFVAYLVAETIEASGVLAVVTAGLYMSQVAPRMVAAEARVQGSAFWTLVTFVLNGALFVLIGLQLPVTVRELSTDTIGHAALLVLATYVTLHVVRFVFLNVSIGLIRLLDRRPRQRLLRTTARGRVVSTVAAFRGGISLAMALSVPPTLPGAGGDFPARDLIVFVTGSVVVLSLVVQGFALPRVIRWARLPADTSVDRELRLAQVSATQAALDALPELAEAHGASGEVVDRLRLEYTDHLAAIEADADDDPATMLSAQYRDLRLGLIARKREAVVRLRDDRTIDDTVLRRVQSVLDAEEVRLRGPAQQE